MKNYGHIFCRRFFMDATICDIFAIRKKFIILVLFLSAMSPILAAPLIVPMNLANHKEIESSIFKNPCGVEKIEKSPTRHNRQNNTMKALKLHILQTISEYTNVEKKMASIYKSTLTLKKQLKKQNLPTRQWQEYFKFRQSHQKNELIPHFLPRFHERLMEYGEALEKLSSIVPSSDSNVLIKTQRQTILHNLKTHLRALICEVETSINVTIAEGLTAVHRETTKVGQNWPMNPDITFMLTIDSAVFVQYKSFLGEWNRIIKDLDSNNKAKRKNSAMAKSKKRNPNMKKRSQIRPQKKRISNVPKPLL